MNGDTFADGRTVIISNADVAAIGIGRELLGKARSRNRGVEYDQAAARSE
jgi:hypothetical protein